MTLGDDEVFDCARTDVCWLYAVQAGVYVMSIRHRRTKEHLHCKVGMSSHPHRRANTVTSANFPNFAQLVYFAPHPNAEAVEAAAHAHLLDAALGREYFACSSAAGIAAVQEALRCC